MNAKTPNLAVLFLCTAILLILLASMREKAFESNGLDNLYVYQAQSFLHGKLNIEEELDKIPGETVTINGKYYSIFPPFPAVLLLPFVAVFGGASIKISLIAAIISLVTCYLLYGILKQLEIDEMTALWVIIAFIFGTAYWQTLRASNGVWMFAQITSVCFILLAVYEALGSARGGLAGLFLGLAFLSRQLSIYSSFFIIVLLWQNARPEKRLASIFTFFMALGVCVTVYIVFNYMQFGEFDTGYSKITVGIFLGERIKQFGLFSGKYFLFNFIYMFLQGFHLEFGGADHLQITSLDPFGTSLIAASPFVFAAFFAKTNRYQLWGAWLSITSSLIHMLFYFNNGFVQFNAQRFSLDFMPVLILLVASGLKNVSKDLASVFKGAIIYAVVLNFITLIFVG